MSIRILIGTEAGSTTGTPHDHAMLFDSSSGVAFGPVFRASAAPDGSERDAHDTAEAFCAWLLQRTGGRDARALGSGALSSAYVAWREAGCP